MATTRDEIRTWLEEGVRAGATHVLVVCDGFDHEDYPVLVFPGESPHEAITAHTGRNMQRLMECYALHLDLDTQLREHRARHEDDLPGSPSGPPPRPSVPPSSGRHLRLVR